MGQFKEDQARAKLTNIKNPYHVLFIKNNVLLTQR